MGRCAPLCAFPAAAHMQMLSCCHIASSPSGRSSLQPAIMSLCPGAQTMLCQQPFMDMPPHHQFSNYMWASASSLLLRAVKKLSCGSENRCCRAAVACAALSSSSGSSPSKSAKLVSVTELPTKKESSRHWRCAIAAGTPGPTTSWLPLAALPTCSSLPCCAAACSRDDQITGV